jgi:hypothetical protein
MADDPPDRDPPSLLGELDLGGAGHGPRLLGNLSREITAIPVRDLTQADIAALNGPRGAALPRSIQRLRSSHHSLARCLASGMKASQAAAITGYTQNRISLLQLDPTFNALVSDYRAESRDIIADLAERMTNLSLDAIEELQDRLSESPESFSINTLLDVVKATADRTGHGPNQDVTLKMHPTTIDRPPQETYEEWQARRIKELEPPEPIPPTEKLN